MIFVVMAGQLTQDYAPVDTLVIERQSEPPGYKVKNGMEIRQGKSHKKYIDYQFTLRLL